MTQWVLQGQRDAMLTMTRCKRWSDNNILVSIWSVRTRICLYSEGPIYRRAYVPIALVICESPQQRDLLKNAFNGHLWSHGSKDFQVYSMTYFWRCISLTQFAHQKAECACFEMFICPLLKFTVKLSQHQTLYILTPKCPICHII